MPFPIPFLYPYDPTGTQAANKITAEHHVVTPPSNVAKANFIVPRAAPFFAGTFQLRTGPQPTDPLLVEGVDYDLVLQFMEATNVLFQPIYGAVVFNDHGFNQDVYLTYQTMGGPYVANDYTFVENFDQSLYHIRLVSWTQIVGLTSGFPPLPHPTPAPDLTGMAELVAKIQELIAAISANGSTQGLAAALQNHLEATSGAHPKGAVGLGNLDNFGTATHQDADDLVDNKFLTPEVAGYMINRPQLIANGIAADLQVSNKLPTGTDLDDVVATGDYYYDQNDTTIVNAPPDCPHGIMVVKRRDFQNLLQIVYSSDSYRPRIYYRVRENSSFFPDWGGWQKIVTTGDLVGSVNDGTLVDVANTVTDTVTLPAGTLSFFCLLVTPGGAGNGGGDPTGGPGGSGGSGAGKAVGIYGDLGGCIVRYHMEAPPSGIIGGTGHAEGVYNNTVSNPDCYVRIKDPTDTYTIMDLTISSGWTGAPGESTLAGGHESWGGRGGPAGAIGTFTHIYSSKMYFVPSPDYLGTAGLGVPDAQINGAAPAAAGPALTIDIPDLGVTLSSDIGKGGLGGTSTSGQTALQRSGHDGYAGRLLIKCGLK